MKRHSGKVCKVYKKVYQALASESVAARETAHLTCLQARKYKIDPDLSAWEIIDQINARNAEAITDTNKQRSTEPCNTGIPDKKYPPSDMWNEFDQCFEGLKKLGVSDQNSRDKCAEQFLGEGTHIGNIKKAVMNRLAKQYPDLSRKSIEMITNNAIRETINKEARNKSKRGLSPLQRNSRHIYAASLNQAPAYLLIDQFQKGNYLPELHNHSGNIKSASIDDAEAWATINAYKNGQRLEKNKPKILSASVNKVTPWRLTGSLADKRESLNRTASQLQTQNTGNIKSASLSDYRPSFLITMQNTKDLMGWTK